MKFLAHFSRNTKKSTKKRPTAFAVSLFARLHYFWIASYLDCFVPRNDAKRVIRAKQFSILHSIIPHSNYIMPSMPPPMGIGDQNLDYNPKNWHFF